MGEITFDPPVENAYPIGVMTDDKGQLGAVSAFSEGELDLEERQDSLVGRIAGEVARAISEGELQPGADLNSVELAARFGTSRTPVREALMLLEKEGLVEIPPRRRPRVAQISLAEVEELYQIRSVLNGLMMRQFVRSASDEELQEAVEIYRTMCRHAEAGEMEAWSETRRRIHNYWADHCGNQSLRKLLSSWKMRMSVGRLVGTRPADMERAMLDHRRLVLACLDRDETLAGALIQSMTLSGLSAILAKHRGQAGTGQGGADAVERLPSGRPRLHIV